jgi:hypothetical protein
MRSPGRRFAAAPDFSPAPGSPRPSLSIPLDDGAEIVASHAGSHRLRERLC